MQQSELLVLENDSWFWSGFEDFLKTISPAFEKFNPSISEKFFVHKTSVWFAMALSQPTLKHVAMQSAFENKADGTEGQDDEPMTQLEYLLKVVFEVMRYRERMDYPPLTFHVVYNGDGFMDALKSGELGESSYSTLSLILRQQDNIEVVVYNKDYQEVSRLKGKNEG